MRRIIGINRQQAETILTRGLAEDYFKYILWVTKDEDAPSYLRMFNRFVIPGDDKEIYTEKLVNIKWKAENVSLTDEVLKFWSDSKRKMNGAIFSFDRSTGGEKRLGILKPGKENPMYRINMHSIYLTVYWNSFFDDKYGSLIYSNIYTAFCIKNNLVPECYLNIKRVLDNLYADLIDAGLPALVQGNKLNKDIIYYIRFKYSDQGELSYSLLDSPSKEWATYLVTRWVWVLERWTRMWGDV